MKIDAETMARMVDAALEGYWGPYKDLGEAVKPHMERALTAALTLLPDRDERAGMVTVPRDKLVEIERMFQWYGDLHAAKPDADKAKRNYDMADMVQAMIAAAEKPDET